MLWLFCDEAGNTGIDLCGLDQPFFVAVGYLVDDAHLDVCREIPVRYLREINRVHKSNARELKSGSFLGSVRGRRRLAAFAREIEAAGAIPLVVAVEKRFSLGGRFVDDFFDLGNSPRAGPEYCLDRDTKRAAATVIGESAEHVLLAIETALRENSTERRRAAVEAVIADLRGRGEDRLAYIAEGALLSPSALAPQELLDIAFPNFATSNAPNPTSLHLLIYWADQLAIARGEEERVRLVHDDTAHMEAALRHIHWVSSDGGVEERMRNTPYLELPPRVTRVDPPVFVRSEDEPMVQAADLLAGGVAYWLKKGYRKEALDASTREIAEATLTIFADAQMAGTGAVISDSAEWLSAVAGQLDRRKWRPPRGR